MITIDYEALFGSPPPPLPRGYQVPEFSCAIYEKNKRKNSRCAYQCPSCVTYAAGHAADAEGASRRVEGAGGEGGA